MKLAAFLSLLAVTACSVLPEQVALDIYQLPAAELQQARGPGLPGLRLARPRSSEALAGSRLLIKVASGQLQAYQGVRLSAPVPQLWRDWLLDAYWQDGRVEDLSIASDGLGADLELGGFLRAFHVEQSDAQTRAVIRYDAMLIRTADRQIIARRRFDARQTIDAPDINAAITGLGAAAEQLGAALIDWSVQEGLTELAKDED